MKDPTFIKENALAIVLNASQKITPVKLEKILSDTFSLNKRSAKKLIRELVASEALVYTYQYGNTFLERSFEKPARVSPRIILSPPNRSYDPAETEVLIKLAGGASFGTGAHPTTRLCLRALDRVLARLQWNSLNPSACLDMGTGSGVLIIAAIKLGIEMGLGLDIDAMALTEARYNVNLNGLGQQIRIEENALEQISEKFSLITANLRYPTLTRLADLMHRVLQENGRVILSGFKPYEQKDLETTYVRSGFEMIQEESENGWSCMVLKKK